MVGIGRMQDSHLELYRKALVQGETMLGLEHPYVLQNIHNLGGGPDDAETLQSIHNVAGALRNQGRYIEAEALYRIALAVREKTLGRNHPNTLSQSSFGA